MKHTITIILCMTVILSSHAGVKYNVRTAPGAGEYATVTAALAACADNALDRDTIDVLGTFTESVNVNKSVVIRGAGWSESILQAFSTAPVVASPPGTKARIFTLNTAGKIVDIVNLTVRYGYASVTGGGILVDKINGGKLVLNKVKVSDNYSETHSGGVAIIGSNVNLVDCYITSNRSKTVGGGGMHIVSNNSGTDSKVTITGSTIANNLTDNASGGGLSIDGNTTFGNTKLLEVNIQNSTIAFNESATTGGGFFAKGTPYTGTPSALTNIKIWINHCTIAYNKVTTKGTTSTGIGFAFADVTTGLPGVDMHNTIITKNDVYVDATTNKNDVNFNKSAVDSVTNCIFGTSFNLTSATTNLYNKTGKFDIVKLDNELKFKGSVVPALPIQSGSIAIDSILTNYVPMSKDQRNYTRDSFSDVGAYEFKKVQSITIDAVKNTLAWNNGNPETTNISVSFLPIDADSTFFKFEAVDPSVLAVNNSTKLITPLMTGQTSISAYSQDKPLLLSNNINITVSNGTTTSVDNAVNTDQIKLQNNPVRDILKLTNSENIKELSIWTLSGLNVYSGIYNYGVNVATLKAGSYIVRIKTKDNEQISQLFIKN